MSDTEYRDLIKSTSAELTEKQHRLTARIGSNGHFDWSQDSGQIVFSSPGEPTYLADIQFVGDISKSTHTWLWAWANPTVHDRIKAGSESVRNFGRAKGIDRLVRASWPADEADAWEMTGIAARVLGAEAAYRTEDAGGYDFMVLSGLRRAPEGFRVDHSGDKR